MFLETPLICATSPAQWQSGTTWRQPPSQRTKTTSSPLTGLVGSLASTRIGGAMTSAFMRSRLKRQRGIWSKGVVHFAVCGFLVYITTSANAASNGGKSVCDIKQLEVSIGALQNPEWKVRSEAYYRIITLGSEDLSYIPRPLTQLLSICQDRADAIKISLIRLLERENLMVQDYHRTGRRFGEEYSNYYGDVISAVSSLKDKRAINALLGAISSGGMATR